MGVLKYRESVDSPWQTLGVIDKIYTDGTGGASGDTTEWDAYLEGNPVHITTNATSIRSYGLYGNPTYPSSLITFTAPYATTIGEYGLTYNRNLTIADFSSLTNINQYAFQGCSSLIALILRSEATTPCSLFATSAFQGCCHILGTSDSTYNPNGQKDGYIYVPAALVATYKSATVWSMYASQFRALEDYTVDGTITGELDKTKI